MKKRKNFIALVLTFLSLMLLNGCGEKAAGPLDGDWAYIHEDNVTVLSINGSKAEYDGYKFSCSVDDEYIHLKGNGKDQDFRYEMTNDGFLLYKKAVYEYSGEGTPESVIGTWENPNKWSYEFTEEGTFNEDGYFPGYYSVDEAAGTIKLVYNDHFVDTTIFYTLEGTTLTIDYPWEMVKTK